MLDRRDVFLGWVREKYKEGIQRRLDDGEKVTGIIHSVRLFDWAGKGLCARGWVAVHPWCEGKDETQDS